MVGGTVSCLVSSVFSQSLTIGTGVGVETGGGRDYLSEPRVDTGGGGQWAMAPPLTQKEGDPLLDPLLYSVFFLRNDPFIHDYFHFFIDAKARHLKFLSQYDNGRV